MITSTPKLQRVWDAQIVDKSLEIFITTNLK